MNGVIPLAHPRLSAEAGLQVLKGGGSRHVGEQTFIRKDQLSSFRPDKGQQRRLPLATV